MATLHLIYARHNEKDQQFARQIQEQLQTTHTFTTSVVSSDSWGTDIKSDLRRQIRRADKVLFIISAEAYASRLCCFELDEAMSGNKTKRRKISKVIPLLWRTDKQLEWSDVQKYLSKDAGEPISAENLSALEKAFALRQTAVNRYNWLSFYTLQDKPDTDKGWVRSWQDLNNAITERYAPWRAFFSYSREDMKNNPDVSALKDELQRYEPIWFDSDAIGKGKDWLDEIHRGIERSLNFMCVVSTHWLTSPVCHRELNHALLLNKRIVAVFIDHFHTFDERTCREKLASEKEFNRWRDETPNITLDEIIEKIRGVWAVLHHQSHRFEMSKESTTDSIAQQVEKILAFFNHDADYINKHTLYLIRAKDYDAGDDGLLSWREVLPAWRWSQQHKNNPNPPSITHHRYIRDSIQHLAMVLSVFLSLVLIVVVYIFNLQRSNALTVAAAAQSLANETTRRLQVQATYNETRTYELPETPSSPLLAFDALWVRQGANHISRITLNGLEDPITIETGQDPKNLTEGVGYLWTNNVGDGTLTRIDPQTLNSQTISIGQSPNQPIFTTDSVWVQVSGRILRLNPQTLTSSYISVGLDVGRAFSDETSVWYLYDGGRELRRIIDDEISLSLSLPERGLHALVMGESVFVMTSTSILRVSRDGHITQTIPLNTQLSQLIVEGEYLWGVAQGQIIRIHPQTGVLDVLAEPDAEDFKFANGRLWVYTTHNLVMYSPDTLERLAVVDSITDSRALRAPISDGRRAWFVHHERGTVYLVNETTGLLERDFLVCRNPSEAIYDGASMWFTCPEDNLVQALPADIYFFGESTILNDTESHTPLLIDHILWLTQQGTGRIIAFDMQQQREIAIIDYGRPILSLLYDAPYLWTGVVDGYELIRIDTRHVPRADPAGLADVSMFSEVITLANPISELSLMEDQLWVQTLDPNIAHFLTLVHRDTLVIYENPDVIQPVGGVTYHDGIVWSTSFDLEQGHINRLNPQTGDLIETYPVPATPFGAYAPMLHEGILWFTPALPPPKYMLWMMTEMEAGNVSELPYKLVGIDPKTGEMRFAHQLPTSTYYPKARGNVFWMSKVLMDFTGRQLMAHDPGVFAIDITTGTILGEWSVCNRDGIFHLIGEWVWVGCLSGETSFGVVDPNQTEFLHRYDHLGTYPNNPYVSDDGAYALFTFEETNTGALFDINTGIALKTFGLGENPQAPIFYDGAIWVYNAGSDTLQRLSMFE